jgi:hypothetical protein
MLFPGTLGVPEPVFAQVLEGIVRSLKSAANRPASKRLTLFGDHGGGISSGMQTCLSLPKAYIREGDSQTMQTRWHFISFITILFVSVRGSAALPQWRLESPHVAGRSLTL